MDFVTLCSDPDDRLAPRPILARYCETDGFLKFSIWLVYKQSKALLNGIYI